MPDILVTRCGGVVTATYNRLAVLNAFRSKTYDELYDIVQEFADDDDCKVLVITGTGRAFSAGQDLNELSASDFSNLCALQQHLRKTQQITRILYQCNKPSIAAINGLAIGVGIEIALGCTLRIAVQDSYFQFTEAKRGLFQTNGALFLLPRLVGLGRATDMMMTGEKIDAPDALAAGLISRMVPSDQLQTAVDELVENLLQSSEQSLRLLLQGLRLAVTGTLEDVLDFEVKSNLALIEAQGHVQNVKDFADPH